MQLPRPGDLFGGKYKLQEVLGKGGFATVYRAADVAIGRDVAIKVLQPGEDGYPRSVESRFMREAQVIAALQDPHTITMFDFGRDEHGLLYMVFEFVEGEDLSDVLKRGRFENRVAAYILHQLLQSLREAHHNGVLHRDVKPANVLIYEYLGDPHRVKLLDFGIAKYALAGADAGAAITRDGAVVGTPRYMAPEQIYGEELTPASDLYSLGLVAHEMLTGTPAIAGANSEAVIRAQVHGGPIVVPPSLGIDPQLGAIVDKLTRRDALERYASADEVIVDLERLEQFRHRSGPIQAIRQDRPAPSVPRPVITAGAQTMSADSGAPSSATEPPQVGGASQSPALSNLAVVALGLLIGVGAVIGALVFTRGRTQAPPPPVAAPLAVAVPEPLPPGPVPVAADRPVDAGAASADLGPGGEDAADERGPDAGAATLDPELGGCGKEPQFRGTGTMSITTGLQREEWFVYVPDSYRSDRKHRVAFVFHDDFQTADQLFSQAGMASVMDEENVVVIGPPGGTFRAYQTGYPMSRVENVLRETARHLCLDFDRMVAIGNGSGGVVADRMRCEFPIRAVAVVSRSPLVGEEICMPDDPVPFLHLYGNDDGLNPIAGGPACGTIEKVSLQEKVAAWHASNKCSKKSKTFGKRRGGKCKKWECGDAPFGLCELDGGHVYSVKSFQFLGARCMGDQPNYPVVPTIWTFFEDHVEGL